MKWSDQAAPAKSACLPSSSPTWQERISSPIRKNPRSSSLELARPAFAICSLTIEAPHLMLRHPANEEDNPRPESGSITRSKEYSSSVIAKTIARKVALLSSLLERLMEKCQHLSIRLRPLLQQLTRTFLDHKESPFQYIQCRTTIFNRGQFHTQWKNISYFRVMKLKTV